MVKIVITNDTIDLHGHTLYADDGSDIVCAALSSIVITSVNAIDCLEKGLIKINEEKDLVSIVILKENNITKKLIANMISLIEDLASQYKDHIEIERKG